MYTLLSTGDVPGAATYFNPLLQQTIIPCTSGTRPSSPPDGMLVWETDTERYSNWNATLAAWVPLGQMVSGTFTPTLTASTTNPVLGTGGTAVGRYTLFSGRWCAMRGSITFGTTGRNAGSGQYLVALPFTTGPDITTGVSNVGSVIAHQSSGGAFSLGNCYAIPSSANMAMVTSNLQMTNASPWTWAASDYFSFTMVFETA